MKYIFKIMFIALLIGSQSLYAQGERGKELEREIKTSGQYYYGEGMGYTLEASSDNALDDLKLMITEAAMTSNSNLTSIDFKGFEDDIESVIFDLEGRYKVLKFVAKKDVEFQNIGDKKVFVIRNSEQGVEVVAETNVTTPEIVLSTETTTVNPSTEIVLLSGGSSSTTQSQTQIQSQTQSQVNLSSIDPIIRELLPLSQYESARQILNNYKLEGRVMYGQLATLTSPHNCYFLVLDNNKIVDVLDRSAGTSRKSLKSGNIVDYRATSGVVLWIYIL